MLTFFVIALIKYGTVLKLESCVLKVNALCSNKNTPCSF